MKKFVCALRESIYIHKTLVFLFALFFSEVLAKVFTNVKNTWNRNTWNKEEELNSTSSINVDSFSEQDSISISGDI